MTARGAIYFAPDPGSALEELGRCWLGRDPLSGAEVARPAIDGLAPARIAELTAEPRRYGFHATLKAPFALADGATAGALVAALEAFAAERAPCRAPPLEMADIDGFLALVPGGPAPALDALAADCVRAFDAFRAPPSSAELAQRRAAGLSPRQDQHLCRWGYPYVLDEFRFHLSLTARIADPAERRRMRQALEAITTPVCREPLAITAICLFEETDRRSPFRLTRRFAFQAARKDAAVGLALGADPR